MTPAQSALGAPPNRNLIQNILAVLDPSWQRWFNALWRSVVGLQEGSALPSGQYFTATASQTVFTPTNAPGQSNWVFVNGLKQRYGSTYDWTVAGVTVVFNNPLTAGDVVEIIG